MTQAEILMVGSNGAIEKRADQLAEERALTIGLPEEQELIILRTPGHDEELVLGFLITEGQLEPARKVSMSFDADHVTVESQSKIVINQVFPAMTACGLCGRGADAMAVPEAVVSSAAVVDRQVILAAPETLRKHQTQFEKTGSIHAAGLFDADGKVLVVREDVGRHNAVDKVIGWRAGHECEAVVLCVSGRVSFDIVKKAVIAQIPIIVAVSGPSSLAVTVAQNHRVTLCGFVRDSRFNVYSCPHRIKQLPRFLATP